MNISETVDFIKNLIEEAIDEAEDNGSNREDFIPNCSEAIKFIETVMVEKDIIGQLAEKCDSRLSSPGYKDYIIGHIGEALDTVHHGGCLLDLDNIVHLKEIMGINISYEMYSYIDSCYDDSLLELCEDNKDELLKLLFTYIHTN